MKSAIKKLSLLVVSSGLLLTSGILAGSVKQEEKFIDPITDYAKEPVKYQFAPKYADGDEDEPVAEDVSKVTLHYHNDDGKCGDRAFYLWTTGVDGKEFLGTVKNNGKDMELELDFSKDAYKALKNKFSISLIIKYKGTWNGQSEDTVIKWSDFPPNEDKAVVVWMVPGIGSAIECYKTEEETKSDKVTETYFSSFKKIHVQSTAVPNKIRIYSYDAKYLAMSSSAQAKNKETRLFKELDAPSNPKKSGSGDNTRYDYDIVLNYTARVNIQYVLETEYPKYEGKVHSIVIPMHKFYSYDGAAETKTNIARFDKYYTYDGNDLGVTYTPEKSIFKVWAPTAGLVRLNIYENGTTVADDAKDGSDNKEDYYSMAYMQGGVWACELEGDLNGKYYTYTVYNSLGRNEVVDPYAKACGANGKRGMILDFSKTNPEGWSTIDGKWDGKEGYDIDTPQRLSIYEAHVRDLTMHKSWNGKKTPGTYAAYAEKGTRLAGHSDIKTGFDHIEELGVTAIQFTPVYDFDNVEYYCTEELDSNGEPIEGKYKTLVGAENAYNWGYNPLNYNCVEGQYSEDPRNGATRVKEFKELIYALATNSNHTRTIMDVVYNHVMSGPNSNFTKLMPRYYFRYTDNNTYWNNKYGKKKGDKDYIEPDQYFNGSGCSNEVKTEAKMMRKFIVDSLCWWAKEYNVKGFRFDLMGLIDVETLKLAAKELYKIDPDIYMYGEGWTGDGGDAHVDQSLYKESNSKSDYRMTWGANTYCIYRDLKKAANQIYVGAFNDAGRNGIRGGNDRGGGTTNLGRLPGKGFMSGDVTDGKHYKSKAMMVGDNTNVPFTNNEGTEQKPKWVTVKGDTAALQTVNYAACHDNYSLFDQFSGTLGNDDSCADKSKAANVNDICRASTVTNISVMLSNGVAFMQGGDELFRTKEVKTDAERKKIREFEDYAWINGKAIAHNAYMSSDDTNAYDWNRKYEVEYLGNKTPAGHAFGYFTNLSSAIKERANLKFKASAKLDDGKNPNAWNNDETHIYYFAETAALGRGIAVVINGRTGVNGASFDNSYTYAKIDNMCVGDTSITSSGAASIGCTYAILVTRQNPSA